MPHMTPRTILALITLGTLLGPALGRRRLLAAVLDEEALVDELKRIWSGDKLTREQAASLEGTV